jgi:hypothetical protein
MKRPPTRRAFCISSQDQEQKMEAPRKLGLAALLFPIPCSLVPAFVHFFTRDLLLFTVHCSLLFVIQITVAKNSPIFGV